MDGNCTVFHLFEKLHEINVLDKTGNGKKALAAVGQFNEWLKTWTGVHLFCSWNSGTLEYIIVDTLLYGREED